MRPKDLTILEHMIRDKADQQQVITWADLTEMFNVIAEIEKREKAFIKKMRETPLPEHIKKLLNP